ncbi:hypothetical protein CEXT_517601 [Caerostris extrusa]|uniref:Uncharacterized protein n=1 Tax=Caerostris extrusa TaxID=172846 RepID=A0AAV4UUN4_CAEEX|nr:hypothetical protein CEXT_517601 [Caerostris extrusa]
MDHYQVHREVPENGTFFEGARQKSPSGCELIDFQLRELYKTLQMDIVNNERLVTVCLNTSNEPVRILIPFMILSSNCGYKSRCLKCGGGEHCFKECTKYPKTEKINQPNSISCGAIRQHAISEGAQDSLSPVLTLLRVVI